MSEPRPTPLDALSLYIASELAKIRQLTIEAEKTRQEMAGGPFYRLKLWQQVIIAGLAAVALFGFGVAAGALGYKLGSIPPAPIIIQLQ